VIGLGTGTLASYGQEGDYIRFYEINPEVIRLSDKYFTYRKDSPARIEVVLGDARVSMERERQRNESQHFDVLAVDAFSSDAIPVHLLTRECFQDYLFHLKKDGILAIHISNRYFDLGPVVRNLITPDMKQNMQAFWIDGRGNESQGTDSTDWVLLTSNQLFLSNPDIQQNITAWNDPAPAARFWTDDYSNLFSLLRK
jgi:spermidine synthase